MESTIGLYKTELIRRHGPWRTLADVALATAEWVDWYNHTRLHGELGHIPRSNTKQPTTSTPPLNWSAFADALTQVDYTGTASVELFNPVLRALPEDEIAARSYRAATGCWTPEEASR
jgi:sugar phosphate isomerase/epimerase